MVASSWGRNYTRRDALGMGAVGFSLGEELGSIELPTDPVRFASTAAKDCKTLRYTTLRACVGAQIVCIFTRELNDKTDAAPEIVEAVSSLAVDTVILDGEAIALRPDGMPHPFQVTMRRFGRRLDVEAMRENLPLRAYFFDCLYIDGAPLIGRPQNERFAALQASVAPALAIPHLVTGDQHAAQVFIVCA